MPYSLWRHGDYRIRVMERETGFEPATHCLGSNCATTAPLPRDSSILPQNQPLVKGSPIACNLAAIHNAASE